jgi:hypothetical protein
LATNLLTLDLDSCDTNVGRILAEYQLADRMERTRLAASFEGDQIIGNEKNLPEPSYEVIRRLSIRSQLENS